MDAADTERWRILSPYLDEALALRGDEQAAWLDALGARDPQLAREVRGLLRDHQALADAHFLEHSPFVPASPLHLAPGDAVGAYRLIAPIGQGGMGSVWRAERSDGRFERQAAIKFLHVALGEDGERRFRREGALLARLSHPHIAQLVDAGVTDLGRPYLVLEYVDGEAIDAFCESRGLDVKARVRLFLHVLDAVAHAHANLIVHRDLKPSNILVDRSGAPKLLDFGIAGMVDAAAEPGWTGARRLTPAYASPEQLRGDLPATSSDIYSLGVVLAHLFPAPRVGGRPVPQDLACIAAMAQRPEPGERYASVEAFADDLRAYLNAQPVRARSGNAWYRTRKFVRRYWIPVAATAVVVASLATGAIVAERGRAAADRRFGELRHLANQVLDLDGTLRDLPGATAARQHLVSMSLEYLQGLAADAQGDTALMQELAVAYGKVAHVQGVPTDSNLGQWTAAEKSLQAADALLGRVLAAHPDDIGALRNSATVAHDRMILAQSEHRDEDAVALAHTAHARLERLLRVEKNLDPEERRGLASMYSNIALALVNEHRYAEAVPEAERCAEIVQSYAAIDDIRAGCLSVLAAAFRFEGRLDDALRAVREARGIADGATYRTPLVGMLNRYGVLLREGQILGETGGINVGRAADAVEPLQAAFDLTENAARLDPKDSTSRGREGTAARELGDVLQDSDPARALAVYDEGLRRVREIPNNVGARRSEALLLAQSSGALRRLGRRDEAGRRVQQALALVAATKDYPADRVPLDGAAAAVLRAEADQLAADGHTADALARYGRLVALVLASSPRPLADLRDAAALSAIYEGRDALLAPHDARTGTERLDLWRHWDAQLPGNAFVARQLAAATAPPGTR